MVNKIYNLLNELESCHLFIILLIMSFAIVFFMFSGNSYAFSSSEIDVVVDTFLDNVENPSTAVNLNTFLSSKSSWGEFIFTLTQNDIDPWSNVSVSDFLDYVENYDSLIIGNTSQTLQFQFFDSSWRRTLGTNTYVNGNSNYYSALISISNTGSLPQLYYTTGLSVTGRSQNNIYNFISTVPLYNGQVLNETVVYYVEDYTPVPPNTITLVSSSNHKFGFNDNNQCQAYLTGYDIEDIQFYVDRYINDEWQQFTDVNDYYFLSNENNPYYVFWRNMNYFPVGTYRYRAFYDYDNQYTSDSFSITNMIIDNGGSYDNGSINIDTGNTVDNIKDYFGGQVDTSIGNISENDIESSLGLERTQNPYENFVFTLVDGLLESLVGTSPEYISFKVHSWGQTYKIYVDDIIPNYGTDLRNFLTLISTVVVMIYIIRWITKVVESINVVDVDTTLDLIEEKYSDLL